MRKRFEFVNYENVDSTNDECKRIFLNYDDTNNYIITADSQFKGRGAKQNSWESIVGNLHMSVLLRDWRIFDDNLEEFILKTATCVQDVILSLKNINVSVKAPNDVLLNGKKVAGILVEQLHMNDKSSLIIGIGINVDKTPQEYREVATCLKDQGIEIDLRTLIYKLSNKITKISSNKKIWSS